MKLNSGFLKSLFCFACVMTLLISCSRDRCNIAEDGPFTVSDSKLILTFKNRAGQYLYTQINSLYNKDSLRFTDITGGALEIFPLDPTAMHDPVAFIAKPIYNKQTDTEAYKTELCKKFVVWYSHNESDTLTTCYRAEKQECGSWFTYLKVFHEGVLVAEDVNSLNVGVVVEKD